VAGDEGEVTGDVASEVCGAVLSVGVCELTGVVAGEDAGDVICDVSGDVLGGHVEAMNVEVIVTTDPGIVDPGITLPGAVVPS
jgi:hypothetical protein